MFEPNVDASDCPFDTSGINNVCLCRSSTFLTNSMTCTFQKCGGEVLASAASTAVSNCEGTNTLSIFDVAQLVSIGQGLGSSGTSTVSSSTSECIPNIPNVPLIAHFPTSNMNAG